MAEAEKSAPETAVQSIVLLGQFSPVVFHPAWFSSKALVQPEEADRAEISVIHPGLSSFRCGDWLDVQVSTDRFSASTGRISHSPVLRDLVVGTLNILGRTNIRAIGINTAFHRSMPSTGEWNRLGNLLAPKDLWNKVMKEPGMLSLTIRGRSDSDSDGLLNVKVEPSMQIHHGLFIDINRHFNIAEGVEGRHPVDILKADWERFQQCASEIAQQIRDWSSEQTRG